VKYELGVYIPEDDILHSHSRENLKSYMIEMHCAVAEMTTAHSSKATNSQHQAPFH
jgi:hypothetical protein